MTLDELRNDYDWQEVFALFARRQSNPTTREVRSFDEPLDMVVRIVATSDGDNDGDTWLGLFELSDGTFLFVTAWCDYTGWGCQDGGAAEWSRDIYGAVANLTPQDRLRLGL